MKATTCYGVINADRDRNRIELTRHGHTLGVQVDGVCLEAQFESGDGRGVLWLTEDSPSEEGLHIYLISRDGTIDDALEAGAGYTPGVLDMIATGDDWARFKFFQNDTVYQMDVRDDPKISLRLPPGWKYKKLLSKHRLAIRVVHGGG